MSCRGIVVGVVLGLFAAGVCPAHAEVALTKVGEYDFAVNGCGGITSAGGNDFFVLRDHNAANKAEVYPLALAFGPTGAITEQTLGDPINPGTLNDSEGIAYDPGAGTFWISDEAAPSITEYHASGMPTGRSAPIPAIQKSKRRSNLSLEALSISGDGLTMWTANEQALACDGETARGNTNVSTRVRLTRFTRPSLTGEWSEAGQWAYACDPCAGLSNAQSGLSGLCALPDESLLVLEREVSTATWGRCRIYRVTPEALEAATDVSSVDALTNASCTVVSKGKRLIDFKGAGMEKMIVYEGICLGPRLPDGSRSVLLVSDGGATKSAFIFTARTVSRLCALRLTGLDATDR